MPTYVYKCPKDKHEFEKNVPIENRDDNIECERCGHATIRIIAFTGLTWAPTAGGYR